MILLCTGLFNFAANTTIKNDSIVTKRSFNDDLNNIYSDQDFTYTEVKPKISESSNYDPDMSWLAGIMTFILTYLPIVLIVLAVFLIARALIKNEGSWFVRKLPNKAIEKLELIDEEIIQNSNLDELLATAIDQENYRLAIRYQYLKTLKQLSEKQLINIDKDKTNSDYLLDIKTPKYRKEFSYLAYIYEYVWYGEFKISASDYTDLQLSFINYNNTIA